MTWRSRGVSMENWGSNAFTAVGAVLDAFNMLSPFCFGIVECILACPARGVIVRTTWTESSATFWPRRTRRGTHFTGGSLPLAHPEGGRVPPAVIWPQPGWENNRTQSLPVSLNFQIVDQSGFPQLGGRQDHQRLAGSDFINCGLQQVALTAEHKIINIPATVTQRLAGIVFELLGRVIALQHALPHLLQRGIQGGGFRTFVCAQVAVA